MPALPESTPTAAPAAGESASPGRISAIIPALNEQEFIGRTVQAVRAIAGVTETIVVDGGSKDLTVECAREAGAQVLAALRGRGSQMAAGALRATGSALWFIHADTVPPVDGGRLIIQALADPQVVGGHFRPRFEGNFRAARFLTWLYPKLSLLGLKYGDASLFVRATDYHQVGGFQSYPLFEDLDLLRRLQKRGRMVQLSAEVLTSSRRFDGRSFGLTFAAWTALQLLYWAGVSPHRLARWYPHLRSPGRKKPAGHASAGR